MQALGNDFVVIQDQHGDLYSQLTPEVIQHLADRRYGIGCDQVLIIQPSEQPDYFYYYIFNPDGSQAGQCVNGARCVAWWAYYHNRSSQTVTLATTTTTLQAQVVENNWIQVQLLASNQPPQEYLFNLPDHLNPQKNKVLRYKTLLTRIAKPFKYIKFRWSGERDRHSIKGQTLDEETGTLLKDRHSDKGQPFDKRTGTSLDHLACKQNKIFRHNRFLTQTGRIFRSFNSRWSEFFYVDIGNPHLVTRVNNQETVPLQTMASDIQQSGLFPDGINLGIMQIHHPGHISLRVHERGTGETRACGSGAVAAFIIGCAHYELTSPLTVTLTDGSLNITKASDGSILLQGPAHISFNGQLAL